MFLTVTLVLVVISFCQAFSITKVPAELHMKCVGSVSLNINVSEIVPLRNKKSFNHASDFPISLYISRSFLLPWKKLKFVLQTVDNIPLQPGEFSMDCKSKTSCTLEFVVPKIKSSFWLRQKHARLMIIHKTGRWPWQRRKLVTKGIPLFQTHAGGIESCPITPRIVFPANYVYYSRSEEEYNNFFASKKVAVLDADFSPTWYHFLNNSIIQRRSPKTYLQGAYLKFPQTNASCTHTIIFFPGNGESVIRDDPWASSYPYDLNEETGCEVYTVQYPAYGALIDAIPSFPQQSEVVASVRASIRTMIEVEGVEVGKIIIVGRSIGTSLGVDIASGISQAGKNVAGVILLAGFSTLRDVAAKYAWVIGRMVMPNVLNSVAKLQKVSAPIRIAHGKNDELIPYKQAIKLADAAKQGGNRDVKLSLLDGCYHNDEDLETAASGFLTELMRRKK